MSGTSNSEGILDSRTIQERIDELELDGVVPLDQVSEEDEPEDFDRDDAEELQQLLAFKDEVGNDDEWDCGISFIRESYFEDYARDLAEDIGAISSDAQWPATCIDWERAASELQMDYSAVEYDGITYYYR